ncbi:EF-hand [Mollisia scopiformis]|uniref:Calmodulin n=1 Tax=Mollisia scopiformis TaxID=149040 RepID=A0A194XNI3_MOLSC|nr:EF-hand [Mollisia scopiformis]KUJ21805.1 EF-hand [Mollisia scopiformis]
MASSGAPTHPNFPSRPYSSTFPPKAPERNGPAFGASSHTASRDTARIERERQERERAQREAAGAPAPNPYNITDEQRDEITEAYGLFDVDKDGRIDYHEFKVALKALGFELPKSEILALLVAHGIPPDPATKKSRGIIGGGGGSNRDPVPPGRLVLTVQAFLSIAAKLISERDPREEILRAFALFDADDKGIISLDDLRRVSRELGEGLEEDELVAMIDEFDLEGKGGVGREEFVGICMG